MFPLSDLIARPGAAPASGEALDADPAVRIAVPSAVEALRHPDTAASAAAHRDPTGPVLAGLQAIRVGDLSDAGLIDALAGTERLLATVAGLQQDLLAELSHRDPDGERYLRDEAAPALRLAPATAAQRMEVAGALTGRLSGTGELLAAGMLSMTHARILASAVADLPDRTALDVQARVLPRGCTQTPGEFRTSVRRAVARLDRKDEEQRHQQAFTGRQVICYPAEDGMAEVVLRLAADGAATVMTAINAWAVKTDRGNATDTRTADQRRADAAVELCQAGLDLPGVPRRHRSRPCVNVTVAASTLIGADDQPGELEGVGPVPAVMARRIAAQPGAVLRYWPVDEHGRLLDTCPGAQDGSPAYVPPAAIARHVIVRDQYCVHPGCRRKAWACELDHRIPWPDGPTSSANLQPLCQRHHLLKHHSRWRVRRDADGSYGWTSPTRHHYRYRPPELPVPEPGTAPPPPSPERPPEDDPPPF